MSFPRSRTATVWDALCFTAVLSAAFKTGEVLWFIALYVLWLSRTWSYHWLRAKYWLAVLDLAKLKKGAKS